MSDLPLNVSDSYDLGVWFGESDTWFSWFHRVFPLWRVICGCGNAEFRNNVRRSRQFFIGFPSGRRTSFFILHSSFKLLPWRDKWDLRRIRFLICLHIKWFVWFGRLVVNLIYANVFFRTLIARITRILQVGGTCFPLGNVCMQNNSISYDNLNHSSRKRQRLQIRL